MAGELLPEMEKETVDDADLLMTVYQSIEWDNLYEQAPDVERDEVDDLFVRLRRAIECGEIPQGRDDADESIEAPDDALLRCDGASSGNPGPAGIGMALYDSEGQEILGWGIPIGEETNNVAEYRAMIAGLRRALHLGVASIRVLSDSQLMVRQINGEYKVRNARLQELHTKSMELLKDFASWTVEHVDREENERVDKIAKQQVKRAKNAGT